ncbi:MAG: hypothetical protein HF300_07575 [Ignavibacteria bacterium]|jgi:hypothetical protein|nr:hypothetical protein [Ignavibacteria bacterium]MCU7499027.1 hypothetical protein [Ignavibacteria bacterium]MCU7512401.1 hypothetical protein [Ignavibacteria bacterium]MCU7521752.1 hypothetical protein [Ignavibacteria bacterium]MCU7524399.1 hypothetical protein [Ignavibacteria bacterium]
MNYKKFILPAFMALFSFIAVECDSNKLDVSDIINSQSDQNAGKIGDTVYIKQNPDWKGFNRPMDIIIGHEPFVYVADTYNDRIVMMNLNGDVLGTKSVKHPVALAQDFQDNLIVCASLDTTIQGSAVSVSAVYKIDLYASGHNIASAPITRLLPTNSDFRFIDEIKRREYTGVCVFYDNSFYVSRKGPENQNTFEPDNSILIFQKTAAKKDTLIGTLPNIAAEGTGLLSANKISSLSSTNRSNMDFVVTLIGDNSFKTQWLKFVSTNLYTGYESKLDPSNSQAKMMAVNRFLQPEDAAVDNSGNIYVADAAKDSIFKFNAYGEELQSFGGSAVFKHPYAVAVYNKIVYVADTDNNRILRFVLSTDL